MLDELANHPVSADEEEEEEGDQVLPLSHMDLFGPDSPSPPSDGLPSPLSPPTPPGPTTQERNDARAEAVLTKLARHPTLMEEGKEEKEETPTEPLDADVRAITEEANELLAGLEECAANC